MCHRVGDDARCALVENDIINRDGGLAAVVDDPVVPEGLHHLAATEIQIDAQLGQNGRDHVIRVSSVFRNLARRKNRNPRRRVDAPLRPDDNLAAARKIHTFRCTRHRTVHRDRLLAVAVRTDCSHALRLALGVDSAHPDPLRAYSLGVDGSPDDDRYCPGVHRTLVMG